MKFIKTAIWTKSAIFINCLSWVRQNFQQSQIICHLKNSAASQSKQHDIHFIFVYRMKHMISHIHLVFMYWMKHMTSHIHLISVYWMKHVTSQLPERSCAVWYYVRFDIVYTHSFYFSYSISIVHLLVSIFLD